MEIPVHDIPVIAGRLERATTRFWHCVTDLRRQLDAADALDSVEREITKERHRNACCSMDSGSRSSDVPPEIGDEIIDALNNAGVITDHPYNLDDIPDEDDTTPPTVRSGLEPAKSPKSAAFTLSA